MSIDNPNRLVEEFKKSGEFDRIRRELLTEFQDNKDFAEFKSRIEDVARQRLTHDHNLLYMPQEFIHRELMQELDRRFPIVERSTSELPMLNDLTFSARISGCLEKLLQDHGIPMTVNQPDKEKLCDDTQYPNALAGSDGEKQAQNSGTSQGVSGSSEGKIASVSKQKQNTKDQEPDSMDVDKS